MARKDILLLVRRSTLILPVNVARFVETAYRRGADAVTLDLEDSVPPAQKEGARLLIKKAIPLAAKGGADVMVRVNNDPALLAEDLEASVHPGICGISLPKVESPEEVLQVDEALGRQEREQGIIPGSLQLSLAVETPLGLLRAYEIACASPRSVSIGLGVEDFATEMGFVPGAGGSQFLYPVAMIAVAARAAEIQAIGLLGSISDFRDTEAFSRSAQGARDLGYWGTPCIHPDQVSPVNRVFTPAAEEVEHARRVIQVFEEGLSRGTASVALDGRMIDIPVYERARRLLIRAEAIAAMETRKKQALENL